MLESVTVSLIVLQLLLFQNKMEKKKSVTEKLQGFIHSHDRVFDKDLTSTNTGDILGIIKTLGEGQ